jgi:chromosome transmission fidelity protein 1
LYFLNFLFSLNNFCLKSPLNHESYITPTQENGTTTRKPKGCRCEYANPNAIEDFSDAILVANEAQQEQQSAAVQKIPDLISQGRDRLACPYFATKAALGLGQLLLVPYNILLHKGTRKAWNLDLKGNVVIVDEAHNLLQTLASIHSVCFVNS